jgi:hypothetical protein
MQNDKKLVDVMVYLSKMARCAVAMYSSLNLQVKTLSTA